MIAGSLVLAELPEALPLVLQIQLNLSVRRMEDIPRPAAECLQASVLLRGVKADGIVRLQMPDSFAAKAATILFGQSSTPAARRDIAAELCNMMAGQIAARIKDEGGPFTLEIPSVTEGIRQTMAPAADRKISRADWDCDGDWLTLEIQIHGKDHAS